MVKHLVLPLRGFNDTANFVLREPPLFLVRDFRKIQLPSPRDPFFLFEYENGDVADHDHEIEEAYWLPLERAARELTYEGEQEMVRRAMSRTSADR